MKIPLSAVIFLLYLYFHIVSGNVSDMDKKCASQHIPGQSVVCVCNATYCDTITRINPEPGTYVAYTSSEGGLRFQKTFGNVLSSLQISNISAPAPVLELHPQTKYQEISGFGGAITDSAGIIWKSLEDPRARQHLIDSYCSKLGLEYNMLRLPMGGTDFSTRPYTYDDSPDDYELSNFTLAAEDVEYKIPLIKACMEVATSPIEIVGSIWSPPAWMKTSNNLVGGFLKEEYYQSLANYFIKFLEKYDESGIPVWAVTTTNEPLSYIMYYSDAFSSNCLQWTISGMGEWIKNNLGPTVRNSTFRDVKILGGDDMRFTIPLWFNVNLNHNMVGWIDWNLCLNESGGPNWNGNNVDSPIIVSVDKQEFYKQPMFYAMGHFSKFVPRGSRRIGVTESGDLEVENVAFLTPEDTVVVVLFNKSKRKDFVVKIGSQLARIDLEAKSITTVEFPYKPANIL